MSGLPSLTETFTQSATLAGCCLPFFDFPCFTPVILTTLAPELSAAMTLLPIFKPRVTIALIAFMLIAPPYYFWLDLKYSILSLSSDLMLGHIFFLGFG
jgi:hypothetical protein